jgi:hypothetical protein
MLNKDNLCGSPVVCEIFAAAAQGKSIFPIVRVEKQKALARRNQATRAISEEDLRAANVNDPCPCGSGHKTKRCHGFEKHTVTGSANACRILTSAYSGGIVISKVSVKGQLNAMLDKRALENFFGNGDLMAQGMAKDMMSLKLG